MKTYNLSDHLDNVYGQFPNHGVRPVIGITANFADGGSRLAEGYYGQVMATGGIPLIIPPTDDYDVLLNTIANIDGLLLSGGGDINPLLCGEEPIPELGSINDRRDLAELLLTRLAYNRQMPILGICRGIQTLAVALGGKVMQDIGACLREHPLPGGCRPVKHSQEADRSAATHSVAVEPASVLAAIHDFRQVNSFHHQAVADPGPLLRVAARAADGIIEAVESSNFHDVIGVQWHPECLGDEGVPLFRWLNAKALTYRKARILHDNIVSLDSHCDTPMHFSKGIDIGKRDHHILVDLQKMDEGRLDATVMVAYLPQPKNGQKFEETVPFEVNGPREYADLIFNKVRAQAARHEKGVALARNADEIIKNKHSGKKSIMLGIENGLALEGKVENVDYFAIQGVVYITLCHNGDNDLCDSARGNALHNGISTLGKEVVRRMNALGVMVDLSHASEKSFWDALDISAAPVICSHSSCRKLCDHPRNLTDEQMEALAKKGGVMQLTLYPGFLVDATTGRADGRQADINDFVSHLKHAIEVMGIDHVGVGTDFDGDGGVPGLADASELTNLTKRLIDEGFGTEDISKLWGGNFMSVMTRVQQMATATA